jgi:hypothetical protein
MNVKATTAGFVMAGLVSAGAVTVLVVSQSAPTKQVQFVAPVVEVTPTATIEPVVTTTEAPAPVESTTAPAPVVAPKEAPVAVKSSAPIVHQTAPGTYQDGTPVVRGPSGDVVLKPPPDPGAGNAPQGAWATIPPAVIVTPTTAP